MYRDSFSETGWQRFLRALSASFRLGRFFRVEVRIFWLTLLIMPLILTRSTEGLTFVQGLTWIVAITLGLYFIIWTHEMSHIVAGWRYRIHTPLITLSPLGGLAHMSAPAPGPVPEMVVALAGPAVHILWTAVLLPLTLFLPPPTYAPDAWGYWMTYWVVESFLYMNLFMLGFNLLPCFPMDGGRALRALLARKMEPNRATMIATKLGMIAAFVFGLAGIFLWIAHDGYWGLILVAIGISNYGACKNERLAAMHMAGPYGDGMMRQPWESDPDAWKSGGSPGATSRRAKEPGLFARRKARKEEARRRREAEADHALDAEVDRVLERVSEVGLDGLTAAEKKILKRASKRNQG